MSYREDWARRQVQRGWRFTAASLESVDDSTGLANIRAGEREEPWEGVAAVNSDDAVKGTTVVMFSCGEGDAPLVYSWSPYSTA